MTLVSEIASFVRGQVHAAQTPTTAVGTVVASPEDGTPSDRLLVVVDGSNLAAPVKRARGLFLQSGMRVGLTRYGADWVATCVIVDPVVDSLAGPLIDLVINGTTPHTSNATNTEVICLTKTFTLVPFANYVVLWLGTWASTVTGDVIRLRMRYQSGSSLTTSGTLLLQQTQVQQVSSQSEGFAAMMPLVGIGTGEFTVGGSIMRAAGTGACTLNASSLDQEALLVLRTG